jgi:hypothetical protein
MGEGRDAGRSHGRSVSPVAGSINREWRRDYEDRLGPAPAGWKAERALAPFERVCEVLAFIERPGAAPGCTEGVLRALARRAEAGDPDAARALVQFLLPCLVNVAARRGWGTREQRTDELLSAAWEAVRTGVELRGRPVKIALLRAIEHRALNKPGRAQRRAADREELVDDVAARFDTRLAADRAGRPLSAESCPAEEVVALLSDAARLGAGRDDVALLGNLHVGWSTTRAMAAAEGVTDRNIRYRRAEAVVRVARVLNSGAEAEIAGALRPSESVSENVLEPGLQR